MLAQIVDGQTDQPDAEKGGPCPPFDLSQRVDTPRFTPCSWPFSLDSYFGVRNELVELRRGGSAAG